jgi:thiol-disulfide isomerase/thioredoxin
MPMKLGSDLPPLDGATEWLNGEPTSESLKGRPVLVHFWALSCYLCKQNIPTIRQLITDYPDLNVVAVHMPRQESDTAVEPVRAAVNTLELSEPCAVDNRHALKQAFQNDQGWVPAYYLFDAEGKLRSRTAGEAGLGMLRAALERLLTPSAAAHG